MRIFVPFFTRALVLAVVASAGLVATAACSSKNDSTGTCEIVTPCRLASDAGLCSGPVVSSAACESCPSGYVEASSCTNDDAGPSGHEDGGKDGASDATTDATTDAVIEPEASCGVITFCYPVNDAGVCGAEVDSTPCEPCPTGFVSSGQCNSFEDAGTDGSADAK